MIDLILQYIVIIGIVGLYGFIMFRRGMKYKRLDRLDKIKKATEHKYSEPFRKPEPPEPGAVNYPEMFKK